MAEKTSTYDPVAEAEKALYVGRHRAVYNGQARMWDRLGARSPESFPKPRHAAEVTA